MGPRHPPVHVEVRQFPISSVSVPTQTFEKGDGCRRCPQHLPLRRGDRQRGGAFLGWAVCEVTKAEIPGYALTLPWGRFGLFLLLAALVGLLAAMWPARSAARLNMLTAIKSE